MTEEQSRPDPDKLLAALAQDENRQQRGKLKIFFGYAAGVGKTYAMLEAAHHQKEMGVDVVVGYIEPHTRPETMKLLSGLSQLPVKTVQYHDITLREFDLDLAIQRHPQLILVDELAHTNAPGCRHVKRFKDVEELLKAGIDVYTTVNVQHLESLNDIVASITGITVKERIPDETFDSADQVELVDIEPDDLLERLNKGKIYSKDKANQALSHFFLKDNLVALREIALRRTADRVNKTVGKEKRTAESSDFFTEEHILICLSSSPSNAKVIRTAARMAQAFHGVFTALYVQNPGKYETPSQRRIFSQNIKLAEQLGAKIATVYGENIPELIAEYAKASGVSKIVIGRTNDKRRFLGNKEPFSQELTKLAPAIDMYIIPDNRKPYSTPNKRFPSFPKISLTHIWQSALILVAATIVGIMFEELGIAHTNIVLIYTLGAIGISFVSDNRYISALFSLILVSIFEFFFTDPRYSFQINDTSYWISILLMIIISSITSSMTTRIKRQRQEAAMKAYRTEVLLETSQKLQRAENRSGIYQSAAEQMMKLLQKTIVIYPVANGVMGKPIVYPVPGLTIEDMEKYISEKEQAVAAWVCKNYHRAGAMTDTLPASHCLYLAVRNHSKVFGVVGVVIDGSRLDPFDQNLLISLMGELALALEKEINSEKSEALSVQAEQEKLRTNILRTMSHDLRTPLTSISGNAALLLENEDQLDSAKRHSLYHDIYDDSLWLIEMVENLLSVSRVKNGSINTQMNVELVNDIIHEALAHVDDRRTEHHITVSVPDELLMCRMDLHLIIQVLINLINNAIFYSPTGSEIQISAYKDEVEKTVRFCVSDDGDGIDDEMKKHVFDMFYKGNNQHRKGRSGLGIGLALCKSIILAHGGKIWVEDNHPHGCLFFFTLPTD